MKPYVRLDVSFEPHRDDVGELYESVRSVVEQLRPFGIRVMNFDVRMLPEVDCDDDELPAF